jgi:hypothetical protein
MKLTNHHVRPSTTWAGRAKGQTAWPSPSHAQQNCWVPLFFFIQWGVRNFESSGQGTNVSPIDNKAPLMGPSERKKSSKQHKSFWQGTCAHALPQAALPREARLPKAAHMLACPTTSLLHCALLCTHQTTHPGMFDSRALHTSMAMRSHASLHSHTHPNYHASCRHPQCPIRQSRPTQGSCMYCMDIATCLMQGRSHHFDMAAPMHFSKALCPSCCASMGCPI